MDINKFMEDVGEKKAFYLKTMEGKTVAIARSFKELVSSLKNAPSSVIAHHVKGKNNDFANWLKDVIKDNELAKQLKRIKVGKDLKEAKEKIINVLESRLKNLTPASKKK